MFIEPEFQAGTIHTFYKFKTPLVLKLPLHREKISREKSFFLGHI